MHGNIMTHNYGWVEELNQGWKCGAIVEVANEMQLKDQMWLPLELLKCYYFVQFHMYWMLLYMVK
jgi:hypothetical protein